MAEYFKRDSDNELIPIREEEPWEYMNDKIIIQDPVLSEESEIAKAKQFKIKKALKLMLDEHYNKCLEIIRGKHLERQS